MAESDIVAVVLRSLARAVALCLAVTTLACSSAKSDASAPAGPPPDAYAPVAAYAAAFNARSFANVADFATEDWQLVNPDGVWSRSRDEAVARITALDAGLLKDATLSLDHAVVNYATSDVALVTITDTVTNYDPAEAHERVTSVVVQRAGVWLLLLTQVTVISGGENAQYSEGSIVEGPMPTGYTTPTASEADSTQNAQAGITWFDGLPVSHDFDSAPNFTTEAWNVIAGSGYWTENRADSVAGVSNAYTMFLNGAVFTEDADRVVRFPTEQVVIFTGIRHYVVDDVLTSQIVTHVLVDYGDTWLLAQTQVTRVP